MAVVMRALISTSLGTDVGLLFRSRVAFDEVANSFADDIGDIQLALRSNFEKTAFRPPVYPRFDLFVLEELHGRIVPHCGQASINSKILLARMVHIVPHSGRYMEHDNLDAEVKTRVTPQQKEQLEKLAEARHLKVSDILREAIREKLSAAKIPQPA